MISLRIDAAIKPNSRLRFILYLSLAGVMTLLAWAADLSVGQYLVILIITALAVGYLALSRPILLHLSQPPISKRLNQGWQLLVRTNRGDALWQAELIEVYRYNSLIHLKFRITEPYHKPWSATVFRDQLTTVEWQKLNILASITYVQIS